MNIPGSPPHQPAVLPEFLEGPALPGLLHIPGFVSPAEQQALVDALRKRRRRRLMREDHCDIDLVLPHLSPPELIAMEARVAALGILSGGNRITHVKWYRVGKGIPDHIDREEIDQAAILTLGAGCVVEFRRRLGDCIAARLRVRPGDLYVMSGEVREYVHGIQDGASDTFGGIVYPREGARAALIFNTLRKQSDAAEHATTC
jgi:alkylated DNA repair dioxygenase AlkB